MIGWTAADEKIVHAGMNSVGGMGLGEVTFDEAAKTSTLTRRGIDGDGEQTSFKGVIKETGRDTFTWQRLEGTGGLVEGPSPVVAFKRVKRPRQPKRLQQAK